jgi:hypothetical protein
MWIHEGMLALQEAVNGQRVAEFLATEARHSEFSESQRGADRKGKLLLHRIILLRPTGLHRDIQQAVLKTHTGCAR